MRARIFAVVAIAAVGLGACSGDDDPAVAPSPSGATSTTVAAEPEGTTTTAVADQPAADVTIVVEDGQPVGGVDRHQVERGSTITIMVTSDQADEVHVHGYDVFADVPAGGTVTLTVEADIPGVFEIELEEAGTLIGQLAVS